MRHVCNDHGRDRLRLHAGTDFSPVELTIEEKKRVALCQCKHGGEKPFCDGTHSTV